MKSYIFTLALLAGLLFTRSGSLSAQQIPISTIQVLQPGNYNPGHAASGELSELNMGYQQRLIRVANSSSASQFLQYTNRPSGIKRAFCWGLQIGYRQEHTEGLLTISPTACAKLIDEPGKKLSLGISLGIANWVSNYNNRRKASSEDPLLDGTTSFIELDAGLGAELQYEVGAFEIMADLVGSQLTGNLLSEQSLTNPLRLIPHVRSGLTVHYLVNREFAIGPRIFYRNTFNAENAKLIAGTTDFGLSAKLPRKDIWFALAVRTDTNLTSLSALTAGFGMGLIHDDTLTDPLAFRNNLDLRFGISYPLQAGALSPNLELGLIYAFGKKRIPKVSKIRFANPFWQREEWMTEHKVERLDVNGPRGLVGVQQVQREKVYLTYKFPDDNNMYLGDYPQFRNDTLIRRIGMEWQGVDGLLENISAEVIGEALWPDSTDVEDIENIEPLQKLSWIELGSQLKADEYRVHFAVQKEYIGELGFNNYSEDTLFISMIFDAKDTTIAVVKGKYLTELELAALKLAVMRKKLEFELTTLYGDDYQVRWEESLDEAPKVIDEEEDEIDDRPVIWIRKLRIDSNNPHMQTSQENEIVLKFIRDKTRIPNWEDDQEEETDKEEADSAADEEENLEDYSLEEEEPDYIKRRTRKMKR